MDEVAGEVKVRVGEGEGELPLVLRGELVCFGARSGANAWKGRSLLVGRCLFDDLSWG